MPFEISYHFRFHVVRDFMSFEISWHLRFHAVSLAVSCPNEMKNAAIKMLQKSIG